MTELLDASEYETGDLVAFSGRGPLHLGIRWYQRLLYWLSGRARRSLPKYSHVGMVIRFSETAVFLLEQEVTGSRVLPLTKAVEKFKGTAWHYKAERTPEQRKAMFDYGLSVVWLPYDFLALIRVFVLNNPDVMNAGYCSALYQAALHAGGYEWGDWSPMPDEIVDLPVLTLSGQVLLKETK